ncbi:SDR family NAD(P)-dependent oxidoreductase [Oceanicola sp. S124]|uniref:SDR family NAD(P)-dependent oxidoreductase n=1 Tax=Oceanicola sp. S124 TaxID=1042378 RepID=UPI0002FCEA43|nr:SDR family oxidoreductase [Oceanicola sp. S124]
MTGRLEGKVAIITGATSGIGAAASRRFAQEGACVALVGRNPARGAALVAEIDKAGGRAAFHVLDFEAPQGVEDMVCAVAGEFGGIDVLYNNAGGSSSADGPLTVAPEAEFWRCIRVDLFGSWLMARHVIPHMKVRGGGSIINTASIAGAMGLPNRDAYTAAKGGLLALGRSMAVEFAADGIRVNTLVPGAVGTERVLRFFEEEPHLEAQRQAYLLGLARPEDVVNAALFLASDDSARTTGHMLPVDSGILIS